MFPRNASIALALLIPLAAFPVATGVAKNQPTVKPPKGRYQGKAPQNVFIQVAGRSVELAAFSFPCRDDVWGRTNLNGFRLKRTSKGYRFNADAKALVSWSDGRPDENGDVHMSGRFSLDAKTVRGHFRVKTKRCGDTDDLRWRAAR
jgi:hypothetical protein